MNIEHKNTNFDPYEFKERKIDNVRVFYKEIEWVDIIQFQLAINRGALLDPKEKVGVAHFVEHMLFTGSPTYPNKTAVQEFGKKYLLDTLNAYTGIYRTVVHCKFLNKYSREALHGLYETIYSPLLREEDIESERKIIEQEMWSRLSNQKKIDYIKKYLNNLYAFIPERARINTPGGWIDTVNAITKADIVEVFKSYVQENTTIFLAGKITEETWKLIEDFIKKIPKGEKIPNLIAPKEVPSTKDKLYREYYEDIGMPPSEQAVLSITRIVPRNQFTEEQIQAASTLFTEILHRKVRLEKSWCYSIGTDFYFTPLYGLLYLNTKLSPENIENTTNTIWEIVEGVINGDYREDFETEKVSVTDRVISKEHTTGGMVEFALDSFFQEERIITKKEVIDRIQNTKYEDIIPVFKAFKKEDIFTEILVPKK